MSSPGKRSTKGATQISMLQLRYWSLVIGGMLVGLGARHPDQNWSLLLDLGTLHAGGCERPLAKPAPLEFTWERMKSLPLGLSPGRPTSKREQALVYQLVLVVLWYDKTAG